MTPEERAAAIVTRLSRCVTITAHSVADDVSHPDGLVDAIAATIREAVAAERQACLKVVHDLAPDDPTDSRYRGAKEACDRIMAAICARN